jgi:hypothetical protein
LENPVSSATLPRLRVRGMKIIAKPMGMVLILGVMVWTEFQSTQGWWHYSSAKAISNLISSLYHIVPADDHYDASRNNLRASPSPGLLGRSASPSHNLNSSCSASQTHMLPTKDTGKVVGSGRKFSKMFRAGRS